MIKVITDTPDELFDGVADKAYEKLHLGGEASVELVLVDENEIRTVNREWRKVDKVTDVLSFPMIDFIVGEFTEENYPYDFNPETGAVSLGSIMICDEVAKRQAEAYGHSIERERAYLFLHGLLHLLGYDHCDEASKDEMRIAEEGILRAVRLQR